jgi:electron transport complex protein RnfA
MSALVIILLGTVLIQGSVIALGGTHPPLHARLSLSTELREAAFTIVVITLGATSSFAATRYVLMPLQLDYLRTPAIVFITATVIVAARSFIDITQHNSRDRVLLLLTNHSAFLGMALFVCYFAESFTEAFVYALSSASALAILSTAFRALMERIDTSVIPFAFRGIPLSLISAGLMALALMGFAGLIHN